MAKSRSVLFLFASHPRLSSSAASVRSVGLLRAFEKYGYRAHAATVGRLYPNDTTINPNDSRKPEDGLSAASAQPMEDDILPDVRQIAPNNSAEMTRLLEETRPQVVVFDRMWIEEMFSHYVYHKTPHAMRILDTQDLHSLREGRMEIIRRGGSITESIAHIPYPSSSPMACRELAAIHRSDLTLVCSTYEAQILKEKFSVLPHKIAVAPFISAPAPDPNPSRRKTPKDPREDFHTRQHFLSLGRHDHPPNADALNWLCHSIWPLIRHQLPDAQLHVYGSHFPPNAAQTLTYNSEVIRDESANTHANRGSSKECSIRMSARLRIVHDPAGGILVKGFMASLEDISRYRVLLAPLRYGAGIKGKIADAWKWGTPVVTTPIGCEGMTNLNAYKRRQPNLCTLSDCVDERDEVASKPAQSNARLHEYNTGCSIEEEWPGICDPTTTGAFATQAVGIYSNGELWRDKQQLGRSRHRELYDWELNAEQLIVGVLPNVCDHLESNRAKDVIQGMVWHHSLASTRHLSRYIELKNNQ